MLASHLSAVSAAELPLAFPPAWVGMDAENEGTSDEDGALDSDESDEESDEESESESSADFSEEELEALGADLLYMGDEAVEAFAMGEGGHDEEYSMSGDEMAAEYKY